VMSEVKWKRDRTYHRCEYRTWTLQVWPVGDGRFCWSASLIWIEGNESETLSARGVRASCKEAKAAAIAAVVYRNGEARHESE
jgi:hypothetical protein